MILSTLVFGCAVALVAGQTPNPAIRTDGGELVFLTSNDVLIENTAAGSDRVGLLSTFAEMSADIAALHDELSAEVGPAPFPSVYCSRSRHHRG